MTRLFNRTTEKQKRRTLRKGMSKAEALVWAKLRGRQMLGLKFRRQYSVGPYIVDFHCPALKLAVEIDGDSHYRDPTQANHIDRQAFIERFGIRFLRFTNHDVNSNLQGVLEATRRTAQLMQEEASSN